jgi:DsbE subfamily thiol:disulfide oxidoreductase
MRQIFALGLGLFLFLSCAVAEANFTLPYGTQGNELDVSVIGDIQPATHKTADNPVNATAPLILWFTNQYGQVIGEQALAHALARRGATVWMVDLLDSLLLPRSNDAVRDLQGQSVAALIMAGVKTGHPVTVVGLDRMAVPILRGLRAWQVGAGNTKAVAGAVLLFPNLYRGTPVAGVDPSFLGIVSATNMPVMILEPERGVNCNRLGTLLDALQGAGSATFARIIPDVRDYFPLHLHTPQNETLKSVAQFMKPQEAIAFQALPAEILESSKLLAQADHPTTVLPLNETLEKPIQQQFGLVAVPNTPAPNFALPDLNGQIYRLTGRVVADRPKVTLVNFWASWCPHCIEEIPSMQALAEAYPANELQVLSINFKESRNHVAAFIKSFGVSFPVLIDRQGDVAAQWGVFAFPSSFLVDAQGRVRYSVNASIDWNTPQVKAIINQLIKEQTSLDANGLKPLPPAK